MDFAALYVGYGRARAKFFSLLVGRSFRSFGPASVIVPPLRLAGQGAIVIGRRCLHRLRFLAPGDRSRNECHSDHDRRRY